MNEKATQLIIQPAHKVAAGITTKSFQASAPELSGHGLQGKEAGQLTIDHQTIASRIQI